MIDRLIELDQHSEAKLVFEDTRTGWKKTGRKPVPFPGAACVITVLKPRPADQIDEDQSRKRRIA